MSISTDKIFEKYNKNNIFIETGSLFGCGISRAITYGYKKIISIELADYYYWHCKEKFKTYEDQVTIIHGDSGVVLGKIIEEFDEPITFWLDGHYSGGAESGVPETAGEGKESPLFAELECIKNHKIKNHVLLVDDMTKDLIPFVKAKILEINKNYKIEVLVCPIDNDPNIYKNLLVASIE